MILVGNVSEKIIDNDDFFLTQLWVENFKWINPIFLHSEIYKKQCCLL